jgi:peptidoglycan/xylan/chitin deacetylase (PgdA/CDA1 family)
MKIAVPVIMYHTVGVVDPGWRWQFLTLPWQIFEDQLRFLQAHGYTAIRLEQLYAYQKGEGDIPARPVIFTFDDGYLDNWVYAFPLLKKYGFCGTVFVNPEFVDPATVCRPNLEDLWAGRCREPDLPGMGFLSWAELRAMAGVIETQSHAMTHTWYPSGPDIVDFRHPGDEHVWMDWNSHPARKWEYLQDSWQLPPCFGEPVYQHQKSLQGKRFFPDQSLGAHLKAFVAAAGSEFFQRNDWREVLQGRADAYRSANALDERLESDAEFLERLDWELGESRRIICEKLGDRAPFLCWPGGGYGSAALGAARRYYLASTLASSDRQEGGCDAEGHLRIRRFGVPYVEKSGAIAYQGGRYLHHLVREFQGSRLHRLVRQFLKLRALAGASFLPK